MQVQNITREQVVQLAKTMPLVKLARWYEYGLFIQSAPLALATEKTAIDDEAFGEEKVKAIILESGAIWLPDTPYYIERNNLAKMAILAHPKQASAENFNILCGHDPDIFPSAIKHAVNLVLAGHIHGGQVVAWQWKSKLYPGAFAYRWNGLEFYEKGCRMLVSRGCVDFIPIRWRCPREALLLEF